MKEFFFNIGLLAVIYCILVFAISIATILIYSVYTAVILNNWLPLLACTFGVISFGIIVFSIKAIQKI